jgi:cytochrome c oxidase cbb3-type subunit III
VSCSAWFSVRAHFIQVSALICLCLFLSSLPLGAQQMQQNYQQFEIDRGATLYSSNCQECHADGTGVPGVNLRTGQFPTGSSDADLMNAIRNGIPGTMMPPHDFSAADLAAILAYVRFLAVDRSNPVKLGDPIKGKALFDGEGGCLNCHRVGEKGSRTALNLSDAGSLHPPFYLERALVDPNAVMAEMPESRLMRAVTSSGKVITGRRLNEDTYSVQLIDDHENLVSLQKADLKSLTVVKESPMPSLKAKFTDDQISDLVAYLTTLKSSDTQTPIQYGSGPGIGNGFGAGRGGRGGRGPTPPALNQTTPPSNTTPGPGR